MSELTLRSNRKKNINAYLDPRGVDEFGDPQPITTTTKLFYGKAATEADQDAAHRGKLHTVIISLDGLPDGFYLYKEATGDYGHRTFFGWIKIESGEIIADGEGRKAPVAPSVILPDLEGSEAQIRWAEQLREKAIKKHGEGLGDSLQTQTSARYWIDNFKK